MLWAGPASSEIIAYDVAHACHGRLVSPYKTLRFKPGEIPKGLLRQHSLKEGVRAELEVTLGELVFVDHDGSRIHLRAGESHSLGSQVHHLEDAASAAIEIRFFRIDAS